MSDGTTWVVLWWELPVIEFWINYGVEFDIAMSQLFGIMGNKIINKVS